MATEINQKIIDKLQPQAGKNYVAYDTKVRGFGVRVTAAGVKSYILNYRINGRERRFTIGRCEDWSVSGARARAEELRGDVAKGIDPLAERERARDGVRLERGLPTFADLAREYLEHAETYKRAKTAYDDKLMLETILKPQLGTRKVAEIAREDLSRIHRSLKATPYRANRVLALASAMFSYAIEEKKWRADNPAKGVERYYEDRREYWLHDEEFERVLRAIRNHPDKQGATALELILLTGARKSEVLSATWSQFDLERGIWTKPSHHTKQKRTEYVPLGAAALDVLGRMERHESGYLFPGKFPGTHLRDVKEIWKDIRTAATISQCRIHDLRHTFASHLVSHGESLQVVGKLLGHTQVATTQRYAHVADQALRTAADKFGSIFQSNLRKTKSDKKVIEMPAAGR